jgi:hypothetical protein
MIIPSTQSNVINVQCSMFNIQEASGWLRWVSIHTFFVVSFP